MLNERDGYCVFESGGDLYMSFRSDDKISSDTYEPVIVFEPQELDEPAVAKRARFLIEAINRFLNAGGTRDELQELLIGYVDALDYLPQVRIEGANLVDVREEVVRQDIFYNQDDHSITVVCPDTYVETMPVDVFMRALNDEPSYATDAEFADDPETQGEAGE